MVTVKGAGLEESWTTQVVRWSGCIMVTVPMKGAGLEESWTTEVPPKE